MPKTLRTDDPNLLKAVSRLKRVQNLWGALLILIGGMTQYLAGLNHPVAGLPFIAVGLACLIWGDPALLAAVAVTIALSMLASLNDGQVLLGPDPLVRFIAMSDLERWALVIGKFLVVLTSANQFFFYRLLYGTERATSDDPNLAIIPAMLPNRTNLLARLARWCGFGSALGSLLALALMAFDPGAIAVRALAEMAGSLSVLALGGGLGAAFSPTDEREAALWGIALGLVSFGVATFVLLRLPG